MSGSGRLIGREQVLADIRAQISQASAGSGQFVLITGEAGIGKTAILAELTGPSGPEAQVLRGSCWEGDGVPPYWPWSQVIRASGLPAAELGEAAWLLQSSGAVPMSAAAAADAQFRLFEAVSRSLLRLAARGLVIVALDDLHWADEPSLRLLGFLARAVPAGVVILGAGRDADAPPQLREIEGRAQQIALGGLSAAGVAALAGSLAGPGLPAEVTANLGQRSGGNPFFLRELIRLLMAQGSWIQPAQIPASVAETLRRRLARLSTDCVRLLEWAAVAGRDIDLSLLDGDGLPADETTAAGLLDEARLAGVITASSFSHDLYRETILDGLSTPDRARLNLAVGRALQARPGPAARIAGHLVEAGPEAGAEALRYSLLAAQQATERLGHEDACTHYLRALKITGQHGRATMRHEILLQLAASYDRAGQPGQAAQCYRQVIEASRAASNAAELAGAALGLQLLGHRSGARNAELVAVLREAGQQLAEDGAALALRSRVLAALARVLRHGLDRPPGPQEMGTALQAVELAVAAGDASALATAKLAEHDVMWIPGTAKARLAVIAEMLDAARTCGDDDLVAEARLLRAAALLELGEPDGRAELLSYIALAEELGHARGRWSALTRRATFAQLIGQAEASARLGEQAFELGLAIGEQDAVGCFCTSRWSLVALGVREPATQIGDSDPLWFAFPLLRAWPHAARGDAVTAAAVLGDFSVLDIPVWTGLEGLAAAAVVFAVAGSDEQRRWVYQRLLPHAGTHVVVGGCASYHAAVDHHLGTLAAALGDNASAEVHFRAALAMHKRLGAAGWARVTGRALDELGESPAATALNEFRLVNGVRLLCFAGKRAQLPETKGLADIEALIGAHGADVHVFTLTGHEGSRAGADPMLDDRARAEYGQRLGQLTAELDAADAAGLAERSRQLHAERAALIRQLTAATGLGGRKRRLGDEAERARKTVSARVREALAKVDRVHPELAAHLRSAVHLGTVCRYEPPDPASWTTR